MGDVTRMPRLPRGCCFEGRVVDDEVRVLPHMRGLQGHFEKAFGSGPEDGSSMRQNPRVWPQGLLRLPQEAPGGGHDVDVRG